ncbi:MAG: hypothetical protein WCH98_03605 [Verrucomicrobiota bacterium]
MNTDQIRLKEIHRKAVEGYQNGCRDAGGLVPRQDVEFLSSIGISPQVLLDYAEDFARYGEPECAIFVRLAEIRRDYYRVVQKGLAAVRIVEERELPRKTDECDGIAWLPRITQKARCFLEGSLCEELMYGCSGDRAFLRKFLLTLPGFLEKVSESGAEPAKLLDYVRGG